MFIKVVKVFQLSTSLILKVCNNKEIKKKTIFNLFANEDHLIIPQNNQFLILFLKWMVLYIIIYIKTL